MKNKFKVGDIVRIKERAYRPWMLAQTMQGDMVIVKIGLGFRGGERFTAVYAGEAYDYQQEGFYESDLELVEGRRF